MSTQQINISTMSVDERLSLLDQLWDSLHDSSSALRLSSEQEAELDRRLDEVDAGETGGKS
jgi:putative addiction module component (TIGR02574 family)